MKTIKLVTVTGRGVKVVRVAKPTTYSVWAKEDGVWFEVSENLNYAEAKDWAGTIRGFERVTFLPTGTDARQLG